MAPWISEAGTSNMLKTCHPLSVQIRSVLPIYMWTQLVFENIEREFDFSLRWFGIPNEVIVKHWRMLEQLPR